MRAEMIARLSAHGVKPTAQRLDIAELVLARPQHLSADQILAALHATGSDVSKATVYNTLNLFVERGLLREVHVDPSRCFYDSTNHPHHHFYNVDTGEIADIDPDEVRFERLPEMPAGTVPERVEVVIHVRDRTRR